MKKGSILIVVCVFVAIATTSFAEGGAEEPKAMVEKAVAYYKAQGKEKAFAEISDPNGPFKKGDLFVFVYDMTGMVVARPVTKELIGQNLLGFKDPDGDLYVQKRIELVKTRGRGWQDYKSLNPATNQYEDKTSYVEGYDNYIFCSSTYR